MAMTVCAECKSQVSTTAPSCPHCGALFAPPSGRVTVHDVDMPFWSMVMFLVKLAIAAIPAAIIVTIMVVVVTAFVGGAIGSFGNWTSSTQGSAPIRRSGTTDICYDRSYESWEGMVGYTEFP